MNNMVYYFGMNNLMMVLEQERKHWLLSTDKKKTSQDKRTGDMFTGVIDNKGYNVIAESQKVGKKYGFMNLIKFTNNEMNNVLNPDNAAFPYTNSLDGLLIERIISSQYTLGTGDQVHYKIKFTNCEEVIIPIAGDINTKDVFQFSWIKTEVPPVMILLDPLTGTPLEEINCSMNGASGITWYYPLDNALQPLPITKKSDNVYETNVVDTDAYIGYPLFWFNCNEYKEMNRLSINGMNGLFFAVGNETSVTNNITNIYCGFTDTSTPSKTDLSTYKIICSPKSNRFINTNADFNCELKPEIKIVNKTNGNEYVYQVHTDTDIKMTMTRNTGWTYVNETQYEVSMNNFRNDKINPLIPVFNVNITASDISINKTTDTGAAGIAAKTTMYWSKDEENEYISGLYEWDGIPGGLKDRLNQGEGVVIYAVHNTPDSINPMDKQTAAIILDPGDINEYPDDEDTLSVDIGRAYVLSNDELKYENNAKSEHPKPGRTVARICDIPTSVVQLSDITGIAPTNVVDKKYVRSECSFDLKDKERLYNTLGSRWVKPTHVNILGERIIDKYESEDNEFVFRSLSSLKDVDLLYHNNFRELTNLNPMVDPYDVSVSSISNNGVGYAPDDRGKIIVGGFSFEYIVAEVDPSGGVTSVVIGPSNEGMINLSNFDMPDNESGVSAIYGTSPVSGSGTGLKLKLNIANYSDILTKPGEIFSDLFALVTDSDGLWLYSYNIESESENVPKLGFWTLACKISDYDSSNIKIADGHVSLTDAYINAVLPTVHELPIGLNTKNKGSSFIQTCVTSNCVNIIDKQHTPISIDTDEYSVDMNKFVCDGVHTSTTNYKTFESLLKTLRADKQLSFDSYLLWRWVSVTDQYNLKFEYMICRRSFNNYISSDRTSLLPENKLRYNQYVHTNSGTTVTWNINEVGQMVWVYNPSSTILEKYKLNSHNKVVIDYVDSTWDKIEVRSNGTPVQIVDKNNRLLWNIACNNPYQTNYEPEDDDEIYQQPEYISLPDLVVGADINYINTNHNPMGSWSLVYPRSSNYKIKNGNSETNIELIEMGCVRTDNMNDLSIIRDNKGNDINDSTIVLDQTSSGLKLKVFDKSTLTWKTV